MKMCAQKHSLVIDIGKTHVKLHVLDNSFNSVYSKQMKNIVNTNSDYPSIDVLTLWQWLLKGIKEITSKFSCNAISITTHGATAALIDRHNTSNLGLVLPILDYEYQAITDDIPEYSTLRPQYNETYSPDLPGGLNLGRQLYWLKKRFPERFSAATDILMYPQYWTWLFTGYRCNEITSLGCHTDLWSIKSGDYSSLVDALDCKTLFPPIVPAWFECGEISPDLKKELNLDDDCRFFAGIHDSNASFLRYRLTQKEKPFVVISTGTWTVVMASQVSLDKLNASQDMLANIDATGRPIACARFMGGREFEAICHKTGSCLDEVFNQDDLQKILDKNVYALPSFENGSGPFGFINGSIKGDFEQLSGTALASLYCALMIDYQLDMLNAKGDIFVEGAFLKNPLLCAVLNQLRNKQQVYLSKDSTGTVQGAAYLTSWDSVECSINVSESTAIDLIALHSYREQWRKFAELKL